MQMESLFHRPVFGETITFQPDLTNSFLITNPGAIFKMLSVPHLVQLEERLLVNTLEALEEILKRCPLNAYLLTDHTQACGNPASASDEKDVHTLVIKAVFKLSNKKPAAAQKLVDIFQRLV